MGRLMYSREWDRFELDGVALQTGERIEICLFGYWIPGQIALDTAGWHLLTPDLVEIPLHSGLTARHSQPGISPVPVLHPMERHAPHILLVDDDPALLQALPTTISLRLPQARVDTSNSAQRALEQIQTSAYDLIVSDIKMPGMDGLELLARIRELRPGTPVLLVTGHGEHELAIQALRGGAYDYILKPIDRDYFVAALRRALQTQQLQQQVAEQQQALELHARLLEGLVQQQTHELFEAQAAKEKTINVVLHVLKTPLAHLKERAQVLRLKLGLKREETTARAMLSQGLAEIEDAIAHMERLVQELLTAQSMEPAMFGLHRHPCDLVELCRQVLEEFAASTGCALTCESLRAPLEVEVDEKQLGRPLISLLSLAYKSAPPGSPITVQVKPLGPKAMLTVRSPSASPEVGMQFYLSRKIVAHHGGRLEVQSSPENETTYLILLPRRIDPAAEPTETVEQTQETQALWTLTT